MNAATHYSFNHRTEAIKIIQGPFKTKETASIGAKGKSDILKIAFTPLIANGAIEGVIHEKEFENTFPGRS